MTPFRGFIERDGKREEIEDARLVKAEPHNAFTPYFFFNMELILKNFKMAGTVEAILESLPSYEGIRTLSFKYTEGGTKYEELVFGSKFLAFLDWVMYSIGSTNGAKGSYSGNDGGRHFEEALVGRYKHKVVQKINDEDVTTFPWIEAFHDQWIALLNYMKKKETRATMKRGLDEDDMVRD